MSFEKRKAIAEHCTKQYSWTPSRALRLVHEFCDRFIAIKKATGDYDATVVSPSYLIDCVWHVALLHTHFYHDLCGDNYIHHRPEGSSEGDAQDERYERTLIEYVQMFGELDHEIWPSVDQRSAENESDEQMTTPSDLKQKRSEKKEETSLSKRARAGNDDDYIHGIDSWDYILIFSHLC